MAGKDPRQRLLDAAIDHIATRGVTDLSLRELRPRSAPATGC